jgi:hypothetical protein
MPTVKDFALGWSGPDSVGGTTSKKVGSEVLATRARVSLLRKQDKLVVAQKWSDPVTGDFQFDGLDAKSQRFITLAEYPGNPDDPAEENYLRPVAGVTKKPGEA